MNQHRIAVCCGEGFASGFLASHLNIFAAQEGISDKVLFVRVPYADLYANQHHFEMAMILPHIEWKVKEDKKQYDIPLYIIPFKVMMKPKASDFVQDCADILNMAQGKGGLFCFPGEERTQSVTRLCSHAQWVAEHM
ncbi:MAG: hypothetical protein ACI32N_04205 [Bulleidia sp.]